MSVGLSAQLSPRFQQLLLSLEQSTEQSTSLQDLLAGMFPLLLQHLEVDAAVIWLLDPQGALRPAFQERWQSLGILSDPQRGQLHRQLLTTAASRQQIILASPQNRPAEELPLDATFILVPLIRQHQLQGVIELVFPAALADEDRAGIVQVAEACAGYFGTYQEQAQDSFVPRDTQAFWQATEPFLLRLYHELDSRHLAYEAANVLCQGLGVDRVSVFGLTGIKPRVLAISGQAKVSGYSPLIKQLRSLTGKVLKTRQPLMHKGKEPVTHPEWTELLSQYLEQSGTQMLAIMPLWSQPEADQVPPEPNQRRDKSRRIVGALVVERSRSSRFDADRERVLELYADHLGNALHRAEQYESIFLLPFWRAIGRGLRWLYRHQFWKSVAVLCCLVAITLSLVLVPWDYRVTGEGALMPVTQRQVFAPWDAEVEEVFVNGGEEVQAGTPLLRLTSKDLEAEEIRLRTLLQEKQTSLRALRSAREISLKANKQDEALEIEGRYAENLVEIRHLEQQLAIVTQRLESLVVTAPIDGVVSTFQVRQLLQHRPVNRGDLLVEVMDPTGDWHLELKLEDRRMGHLLMAQQSGTALPVEYILATDPETSFKGTVKKVGTRANPIPEKGNQVDVQVRLQVSDRQTAESSPAPLPPLRIGAEVKAKINCGAKPLGYVLFGDVIDYLRKTLWL
ncbi:MAG: GAF domain-containing protein [Planctomycetaceae bacterium]|nr:GAF domain-containing protein [Planctomycetaceae bacterium]